MGPLSKGTPGTVASGNDRPAAKPLSSPANAGEVEDPNHVWNIWNHWNGWNVYFPSC